MLKKWATIACKSLSTHSTWSALGKHQTVHVIFGVDWRISWIMLYHNDEVILQITSTESWKYFLGITGSDIWEVAICRTDVNPKFCSQTSSSLKCECISTFPCKVVSSRPASFFNVGFYENRKWAGIYSFDFNTSLCKSDHFSVVF